MAHAAVRELQAFQVGSGALGPHLADQWMLPLALAITGTGSSAAFTCTELSEHARTNIGVIEQFLPVRFDVESLASRWHVTLADCRMV